MRNRNNEGYTLLLAVLIGVLFSIMIVTLITYTMSGVSKNNIREDNQQAVALSQKGITHITNYINEELKGKIGEGMLQDDFVKELNRLLESLSCENTTIKDIETVTGKYDVCVSDHVYDKSEDGQEILTKQIVTFKSLGTVDGTNKEMFSTILIGAQSVPNALNYAIGSNCIDSTCNSIPGEGNLLLHGGVQIEGDMKVDGNIITSDHGYAYLSGEKWIDSFLPTIKPGPGSYSNTAKLVLGGEVYTFLSKPPSGYNEHIKRNNFKDYNSYSRVTRTIDKAFTAAPEIIDRNPVRDRVDVEANVENSSGWINDVDVVKIKESTINNTNKQYQQTKALAIATERKCVTWFIICLKYSEVEVDNYYIQGNNSFGQIGTKKEKNIFINSPSKTTPTDITVKSGMYVGGNLTIGNSSITNQSEEYRNNPNNYDDITLEGTIFVEGDLTIIGADTKLNALIYVNGDVDIQYSRINGKNVNGKQGSLIVFANNEIHISNNSLNQDYPSNIRGYFYSNSTFEMFGVGSNILINGGISARRIVLNGIRGRAYDNTKYMKDITESEKKQFQYIGGSYFEGINQQKGRTSRLQVIYNPGIIGTYSDLKLEEPIIYNLDMPQLLERKSK